MLSRTPEAAPWRSVQWDARTIGSWSSQVDGADVVINLAGRNVNCRYTAENRRAIMDSRLESTRILGEVIRGATAPPPIWLQSSTATIYAHRFDEPNDERSGLIGGNEPDVPRSWDFSVEVAQAWEAAAFDVDIPGTRVVALRSAMVMSPDADGIFDVLLSLVRRGLGGRSGSGRQFVSWIHDQDFIAALNWIIDHEELEGHINICSPHPLPNTEFMRGLREAWGIRIGLPANRLMLEAGAMVMRTETELVLKSRRVVPGRLMDSGFAFAFPTWPEAAENLCSRWRSRGSRDA